MVFRVDHRKNVGGISLTEALVPRAFQESAADSMNFLESGWVGDIDFFRSYPYHGSIPYMQIVNVMHPMAG